MTLTLQKYRILEEQKTASSYLETVVAYSGYLCSQTIEVGNDGRHFASTGVGHRGLVRLR